MKLTKKDIGEIINLSPTWDMERTYYIELSRLREVVKELKTKKQYLWNGISEEYDIEKPLFDADAIFVIDDLFGEVLEEREIKDG